MLRTIFKVHKKAELVNPTAPLRDRIKKAMTLPNPEYVEAVKHGRWTGGMAQELIFYKDTGEAITFLRGYARTVAELLRQEKASFDIEDRRRELQPVHFQFKGELRDYQKQAVNAALERDHGVLEMPTGAGKTTAALYMIAARKQPALVLVHSLELAHQWIERARQFLGVDAGLFGNGKKEIKPLTIATHQTARKHLHELPRHFGYLIADEVHRAPALTYSQVIQAFDCRYLTGLTATGYRRDGLGRLIYLLMGDRAYQIDRSSLEDTGAILKPQIITRETGFTYSYADDYPAMLKALTTCPERNRQIISDVETSRNGSGAALIVSDRKAHLHMLAGMVQKGRKAILTGDLPAKERARIVADLNQGELDVLLSTTALISEGFDAANLDALFIASPIKFKGRLIQTVGRVLRPAPGKRARIYDYADTKQPILAAAAKSRQRVFREMTTK